jgi:hypothetical protein
MELCMYSVAFDISERSPDAVLGAIAVSLVLVIAALLPLSRWRTRLLTRSWLLLAAGDLLFVLVSGRLISGPYGWSFAIIVGLIGLVLAGLASSDADLRLGVVGGVRARARPVAAVAGSVLLVLAALQGSRQWDVFDLERRMSNGNAEVTTGVVYDARGSNWSWECFSVAARVFCYADEASYVGFHQTAANGGPIRNGIQVRVTSIGNAIVRLEIATGR